MRRSDDTSIGGSADQFPATGYSAVLAVRSDDPAERARSWDALVRLYWKPVYKYVRLRWGKSNEEAKDLAQGFFARGIEKGFFDSYDPGRARFRTFLRTCLDAYLANDDAAARRIKRGGRAVFVAIDFEIAEAELARFPRAPGDDAEAYFDLEWKRSLFDLAVATLREECRAQGRDVHFALFQRHDLSEGAEAPPSYAELASSFGISVHDVGNYLKVARKELRRIVLERLRETTATEEEWRDEARALLGKEAI